MPTAHWYHCILTTYGAWLPGDPRGFRTRNHREHIEGDYKNPPPPGQHDQRHARSKELQKYPTVILTPSERQRLGQKAIEHLQQRSIELLSLALGGQHLHLQLKCDPDEVIDTLGRVKRALWYERRVSGNSGKLWGLGRKIVPIKNRSHQKTLLEYILAHQKEGAWTWNWRDARK